jgi:alanine racemase
MQTSSPAEADAVLSIDLGAVAANYRALASLVAPARCAAVVKADAYGLGVDRVAPVLAAAGCAHFFVAHLNEGVQLRALLGPVAAIYVLHGPTAGTEARFVQHDLVPVLNSLAQTEGWIAAARARGVRLPAALQVDSGMGRLGMQPAEVAALPALSDLEVGLALSHLACADDPGHPANAAQLAAFRDLRRSLPDAPASLAASCAIFLGRRFHFDMVRPGAALYGLAPVRGRNPMRPVVRLRARVIQTRALGAGAPVGYGHAWRAAAPTTVATLAIGYADGYPRLASTRSAAWLGDVRLPLAGRVSMDSTTLDASAAPGLQAGDWVDVIGRHCTADDLAAASATIGWEILTRLGRRFYRDYSGAPMVAP